jgi:hypothetical protein
VYAGALISPLFLRFSGKHGLLLFRNCPKLDSDSPNHCAFYNILLQRQNLKKQYEESIFFYAIIAAYYILLVILKNHL